MVITFILVGGVVMVAFGILNLIRHELNADRARKIEVAKLGAEQAASNAASRSMR